MVISQYLFRIYMFIFQDVLTLKLFNFISFINESYTSLLHYEKACDGVDAHYDDINIADANIYCLPNTPITS